MCSPTWFSCARGITGAARRSGSPSGQGKKCSPGPCQILAGQFDFGHVVIWIKVKEYPLLVFEGMRHIFEQYSNQ